MSRKDWGELSFQPVSEESLMPLYHQIYLALREKIYQEVFPHGTALPSEAQICGIFGVSRITAKRALDELAAAGLVVRRRGAGTRVAYQAPSRPVQTPVEELLENLTAMGRKTELELLEFRYVAAPAEVSRELNCEPGALVQKTVRVRRMDGKPFSYLTTYVPEHIGRLFSEQDTATTPLLTLLERHGVEIAGAEQTISATGADADAARPLAVDIGAPLLRIARTVMGRDGVPVEHIVGLYRPDRYQFRMQMRRVGDDPAEKGWSYRYRDEGHLAPAADPEREASPDTAGGAS